MIMIKHHSGFNGFFYIWRELFWVCTFQSSLNRIFPALYDVSELYYKKTEKNRQIAMVLYNLAGNCCDLTNFFDLKKSFYRVFLRLTVFENYPKCRILYFLYFGIFH